MRKLAAMFLLLCGTAVAGLVVLQPDRGVEFEAVLSRLEPEEALRRLREVESQIVFHDNLELLYGQLSLADGDFDTARRSFQRILSHAGPSEKVLEMLAGIEIAAGDLTASTAYLRQAYDLFPASARRERLGLWYRSMRMEREEREILQSVEPLKLSEWEAERLGHLLMAAGRDVAYEGLLVALAEEEGNEGLPFKKRLLEFLVESGRTAESVQYASVWIETDPEPGAVLEMTVQTLIGRGALDAAILTARDGFVAAPQDSHLILPVFAKKGHGGVARILQAEWLAGRSTLTPAEWGTLSYMAETSGDLRTLHKVLSSDEARLAEASAIGQALTQFVRYRGARALVPYRRLLSGEVQEAAPLVAAAWASWSGNRAAAYEFLVAAAQMRLSEWDQTIWISLSDGLRGSPFHRALLAGAAMDEDLRRRLRDSVISPQQELAATD